MSRDNVPMLVAMKEKESINSRVSANGKARNGTDASVCVIKVQRSCELDRRVNNCIFEHFGAVQNWRRQIHMTANVHAHRRAPGEFCKARRSCARVRVRCAVR